MYGKFFSSTFTGSMFGAGPDVFAVWGYVIANTIDSRVELNPHLLASILGSTPAAVEKAIAKLCQPDPKSRNPAAKGRRLQKEGQFQYRVTSHQIYREMKNEEQRRAYNREKQRESRERRRLKQPVNPVNLDSQSMSTQSIHTEAEAEAEAEASSDSKDVLKQRQQASSNGSHPVISEAEKLQTSRRAMANVMRRPYDRKNARH